MYHADCELLIASSITPARCGSCKKQRRSLSAISSRSLTDDKTNPSSHTPYSCLTPKEKDERLHRLQSERRISKLQISRLEKKISELTANIGVKLDDEMHDDMKKMIEEVTDKVHKSHQHDAFQQLF